MPRGSSEAPTPYLQNGGLISDASDLIGQPLRQEI